MRNKPFCFELSLLIEHGEDLHAWQVSLAVGQCQAQWRTAAITVTLGPLGQPGKGPQPTAHSASHNLELSGQQSIVMMNPLDLS
jgi:hypothetical protein